MTRKNSRLTLPYSAVSPNPLKEVLADMLDEEPTEDLVKAVENRILLAQEQEESIDLSKIVASIQTMQSSWV